MYVTKEVTDLYVDKASWDVRLIQWGQEKTDRHFTKFFKCIFLNCNLILVQIALKFIPNGAIINKTSIG